MAQIFFPSIDGYVGNDSGGNNWSVIIAGSGDFEDDTSATFTVGASTNPSSNQFDRCWRGILCFDTSALGSGVTILSATLSLYATAKVTNLGTTTIDITTSTPASTSALAVSDFQAGFGTTVFATKDITAGITTSAYNDFSLSPAGIAIINKTGFTKLGVRLGWDTTATDGANANTNSDTSVTFSSSREAGTTQDPKLTIEYVNSSTSVVGFI